MHLRSLFHHICHFIGTLKGINYLVNCVQPRIMPFLQYVDNMILVSKVIIFYIYIPNNDFLSDSMVFVKFVVFDHANIQVLKH